eukprot:3603048-Alexandrium_andersonii.AAC.1
MWRALSEVARAVNALRERQAVFAGWLVGVEASQRTIAEGANSAVALPDHSGSGRVSGARRLGWRNPSSHG